MIVRYGHFLRYQPPLMAITLWLWLFPVLFFVMATYKIWRDKRAPKQKTMLTPDHQQRLAQLIQRKGSRT